MFIKSIRFKIILWHILILTAALFIFSIALYGSFSKRVYDDIDDLLLLKAEGVVSSIDTYWEAEKSEVSKDNRDTEVFSKVNNINFIKIAQRWVEEKTNDPQLVNIIVQIFDAKGKHIASSRNIPSIAVLPKEVFMSVLNGYDHFGETNIELAANTKPTPLRTLTVSISENDVVAYIVQVASPLTSTHSALNRLKTILFLLLPLMVFITGVIGAFLTRLALSPVDKMVRTIRQITAESLRLRINVPEAKDEIKELAETFNDMLTRLEEGFSSQRKFIEDISHELKTPLSVLKGELEVTLKKIRSSQDYESVMRSNLDEINRIIRILEDLLIIARIESKKATLEVKALDPVALIKSVEEDMKILAEKKGIAFNFSCDKKLFVAGDENQLKRLFINLLDNAIKYTHTNGTIRLTATSDANFAKITVSDTGIGIPEDELPNIFKRFYRVDKSRSSDGFGLGLSIVSSIVEAHRGSISVKSKVGEGTTFILHLPLYQQD